ncbi:hypothetical protein [Rhizobacter sp. Root1221]|uniref:hypothetical protein n=1 Tax=Rhizobacter sp. Root1221 TaxID=1736433 RepID=UPI0006F757EB|nr:hypothetical protein [Rhizobacter sp. Root1221]KQV94759.1 hypothetical protein ASC87_25965 [Rhizobacter sp. Root1221]
MRLPKSLVLLAAGLLPLQAFAVFECNVKVKSVLVYATGELNVLHTGRNDFTVLCNMNQNYGAATPMVCANWFAMLEHIKKKDGNANIYYNGEGSCATLPTYGAAPAPVYVGDVTP